MNSVVTSSFSILLTVAALCLPLHARAQLSQEGDSGTERDLGEFETSDEPTYINAATLNLNSKDRTFVYSGNVEVTQGDLKLTSSTLDGSYDENNEIEELTARTDVHITKGEEINARSNKAVFTAKERIITLTDNPEIEQNGSLLNADVVKVFLDDNRSVAEGKVRVKLLPQKDKPKAEKEKKSVADAAMP